MAVTELVEKYESGKGTVRSDYRTAVRVLMCDSYADWRSDEDVPAYGDAHPDDDDLKLVYIDFEGAGKLDEDSEATLKYTKAKLFCHYSTNVSSGAASISKDMQAEIFSVTGTGTFQTSGNTVEHARGIPVSIGTLNIPVRVAPEPTSTIWSLLGKVNSAGWAPDGFTYPAETVWFAGYTSNKLPDGMYEIIYHFKVNPLGWNAGFDGEAGVWDVELPKVFASASFTGLGI